LQQAGGIVGIREWIVHAGGLGVMHDAAVGIELVVATFWRKIRGLNLFDSVAARPSSCKNVPKYIHTEIYAFC
jgi:hypothetical protein